MTTLQAEIDGGPATGFEPVAGPDGEVLVTFCSTVVEATRLAGRVTSRADAQATARWKTRVAQTSTSAHSGTSTANACHTADEPNDPFASSRDASTR